MHTGRPTDGDNNRSRWPQTPRRSGPSPLWQGSHKEWHVCRLPWQWGSKVGGSTEGQLHGQSPWWSLLASLQLVSGSCSVSYAVAGAGLVAPHSLSLLCAYLLRAFPYGTPGMFSPGTLLISSRKIPLTAQSPFLLRVLWPHPSNYDSFGGSKHLLHPQCLPRAQSRYPAEFTPLGRAKFLEPLYC